jgi:hypothetical protein
MKLKTASRLRLFLWNSPYLFTEYVAYMQSEDKVCRDMQWVLQLYQETGRIPWKCTATKRSYSCSSQRLSWQGLTHSTKTCHFWWSKPLLPDLTILAQYNHEKADSRIFNAVQYRHHAILIRIVDTDVVVPQRTWHKSCDLQTNCGWHSEQARVADT